jgi:hypothetical protein
MEKIMDLDWTKAYEYLQSIRKMYTEIGLGFIALKIIINPLLLRYEKGERSQDLYDKIMELE